jgi:hypothetical protein
MIINRLLRKNMSPARIAGFVLSNFIGLAIVVAGLQFFQDVKSIYSDDDGFIKKDYLVVNKKVTSANTVEGKAAAFSADEISDLERQPWVRKVGRFSSVDYRVTASVQTGGRGMSTYMFFESIPSEFIDVAGSQWGYRPGSGEVPIIISKDYLTLYNFGFASSAGLPQLSESFMGGVPLRLHVASEDGIRSADFSGCVVGFSNRLNTILVPQEFMEWSNERFGSSSVKDASRLIVDVSSPGDVAIGSYIEEHGLEVAGDKRSSQASFLLNVITGIILAVGVVITVLSFFILMLSLTVLMEKNREKIHTLLQLGYPLRRVGAPYRALIAWSCAGAYLLALAVVYGFRLSYLHQLEGLGGGHGNLWLAPAAGLGLTAVIVVLNSLAVGRRVERAWRISR